MCLRCTKRFRRHLIQDRLTGLFVCEQCGYAVAELTESAYKHGKYIWEVNPAWPVFHSFEDLMNQILVVKKFPLPPCNIIYGVPSLILTRAFDILCDSLEDGEKNNHKIH